MTSHHINETFSRSMPTEAAIGEVGADIGIDDVTAALAIAGVDSDRAYYLIGADGAKALRKAKGFLAVFDDVISKPLSALDDGKTIVGVFGTDKDSAGEVRRALDSAGVAKLHYFGKWTYS